MDLSRKIELLEEMLGVEAGVLTAEMALSEINEWDSMASLSLIVLMDEEFGKEIDSTDIKKLFTIQDILDIMC